MTSVDSDSKDMDESTSGATSFGTSGAPAHRDEYDWEHLSEPPDAGEIDQRNSDSSDFEETYIKRKTRRKDKKVCHLLSTVLIIQGDLQTLALFIFSVFELSLYFQYSARSKTKELNLACILILYCRYADLSTAVQLVVSLYLYDTLPLLHLYHSCMLSLVSP